MAKYAQLTATGLPHGVLLTVQDSTGKQVSNLYPEADANAPDNRARFADGTGAISPATYVPNGTYIVAYSGGSQTVVVSGGTGTPADSMFVDLATQAELNAAEAADSGTYATKARATLARIPKARDIIPSEMVQPPTFALSGPGGATPIASAVSKPFDTDAVYRRGCIPVLVNQFSTDYHGNGVNGNGTRPPWWVSTDHNGINLALRFRAQNSGLDGVKFWVWVDGVPATPAPVGMGTLSAGSLYYYKITFPTVAQRRIDIWMLAADFGGIDIGPNASLSAAPPPVEKLAIYGDSYVQGANNVADIDLWSEQFAWYMGMEGYRAGQGSTGYIATGGGNPKGPYTDATRLAALVSAAPDYVLIFGSINDDPQPGVQAAAAAVYASLAASLPSARLIVVGPPHTRSGNGTGNRDAVAAAAAAAPNVIGFIDPIAGTWLTGTGRIGALTGTGNSDVFVASDGAHLNDDNAHEFWRSRTLAAVIALLKVRAA